VADDREIILRFEMGYTPEDFGRRLPKLAEVSYDPAHDQFEHVEADGRRWGLRIIGHRQREIALLRLPVIDVELTFQRYERDEIDAFMSRFHAHFRRGGG
jgi:hypothetical protein